MRPKVNPQQGKSTRNKSGDQNKTTSPQNEGGFKKKEKMSLGEKDLVQKKSSRQSQMSLDLSRSNQSVSSYLLSNPPDVEGLEVIEVFKENQELKIMQLSEDCRQNLKKMQRFDRFIYPLQSDRILKVPIQKEVKRLQKIKNENKRMRGKLYDNELTITALYNHVKLVFQMNRELQERETLRKQKESISKKMHDMAIQHKKQVRELKETMRNSQGTSPMKSSPIKYPPKPPQGGQLSKEQSTTISFIGAAIQGHKYQQAQKQIKSFIEKCDKPEICKIFKVITTTIEQHITVEKTIKKIESSYHQMTTLVEKISKFLRLDQFDQLQKLKNQNIRGENSAIGLMLESLLNSVKKLQEAGDKNKRVHEDKSKDKIIASKQKQMEEQLKKIKQELSKEKIAAAEHLRSKNTLEKQIKTLTAQLQKNKLQVSDNASLNKLNTDLKKQKQEKSKLQRQNKELVRKLEFKEQTPGKQSPNKPDKQLSILKKNQQSLKTALEEANKLKATLEASKKSQNAEMIRLKAALDELKKSQNAETTRLKNELNKQKSKLTELTKKQTQLEKQLQASKRQKTDQQTSLIKNKELITEIELYKKQISQLKKGQGKNDANKKRLEEEIKSKNEIDRKTKEINKSLEQQRKETATIKAYINKLSNLFNRSNVKPQDYNKVKKQLEGHQQGQQLLELYNFYHEEKEKNDELTKEIKSQRQQMNREKQQYQRSQQNSIRQLQKVLSSYEKVTSSMKIIYSSLQKRKSQILKKNASIGDIVANQLKKQKISDTLGIGAEFSNLSSWIQDLYTNQLTQQSEELRNSITLQQKQLRQVKAQFTAYKRDNSAEETAKIQLTAQKNIKNFNSNLYKFKGDSVLKLDRIQQLFRKQFSSLNGTLMEPLIKGFEESTEFMINSCNDELIKREEWYGRKIESISEDQQALKQRLNKSIQESSLKAQQFKDMQFHKKQLNREIEFLTKAKTKLENQKQILQKRQSDNNSEISKLKKVAQDYVRQEKKILEKLELEQREKDKIKIECQALQRTLDRQNKEKSLIENSLKQQDTDLLKLREIQMLYDTSFKDFQMKIQILNNSVTSKDKQLKVFGEKQKVLHSEKTKLSSEKIQLEKSLNKMKEEMDKMNRNHKDSLYKMEKEKYDVDRALQKSKNELKYAHEEHEIESRRLSNTIKKLEIQLGKAQDQFNTEKKQLVTKLTILNKQRDSIREKSELQESRYREKLRQVSLKLQETTGTDQREKIELRKQIQRLNSEIMVLVNNFDHEREDLKKYTQKLSTQLRSLSTERLQERRTLKQEIERVRNQQYQLNREKLRRQQEQIKEFENQVSKYTEIIQINETNYNKIIEDNKNMYEKILELQKQLNEAYTDIKYKTEENQRNKQLSQYIETLEVKTKELQYEIKTQNNEQNQRSDELQKSNAIILKQKYQYLHQFQKISKESISLKNQLSNLEKINLQQQKYIGQLQRGKSAGEKMLREVEHSLSDLKNELFQKDFILTQKQSDIVHKTNQISQLQQEIQGMKRDIDHKQEASWDLQRQLKIFENKISDLEKYNFEKELTLKKQIEINLNRYDATKAEVDELKEYRDKLIIKGREDIAKIEELGREVTALKLENNKMERDCHYWRERSEKKEQEFLSASQSHTDLHKSVGETTQLWKKHGIVESQNMELRSKIEMLQKKLGESETMNIRLRQKCEQYIKSIQIKNLEMLNLSKAKQQLLLKSKSYEMNSHTSQMTYKSKLETMQRSIEEGLKKLHSKEQQIENLRHRNEERVQKLYNQIKDLERRVSSAKQDGLKRQREIDMAKNQIKHHEKTISLLETELTKRKEAIEAKDREIQGVNTRYMRTQQQYSATSNNYSNSAIVILQNTIEERKRQIERLDSQLTTLNKKYDDKMQQCSRLQLEFKQIQMERIMIEDKMKQRVDDLSDRLKEERQRSRAQKLKLEENISELDSTNKVLNNKLDALNSKLENTQGQLEKARISSASYQHRQRQLKERYQQKQTELKRIHTKQETLEDGTRKIKEENRHLKDLLYMLDQNYVTDNEEDVNEIQILIKISEEISELINRNVWLEKQLKKNTLLVDDPWYESVDILVETLINYAYDNGLLSKNARFQKFMYSLQFRDKFNKDIALEKYFMHVEGYLKNLVNIISTDSQMNQVTILYEKTLLELKNFVGKYHRTHDKTYLDSLVRCLDNFEP